mmetsp:Transcript_33514/g.32581  ORF Transcript_33514/g.32581 Transcript_33514/m.32581 type:complete len:128 (-) Transcript_33514:1679-2062(-)
MVVEVTFYLLLIGFRLQLLCDCMQIGILPNPHDPHVQAANLLCKFLLDLKHLISHYIFELFKEELFTWHHLDYFLLVCLFNHHELDFFSVNFIVELLGKVLHLILDELNLILEQVHFLVYLLHLLLS